MKYINKITAALLAGSMLTACNDLDVQPTGSTITSQQKEEVVAINPSMALASVTGIAGMMTSFGSLTGGSGSDEQWDIGTPAMFLMSDLRGMDMYSINTGYNWYLNAMKLSDGLQTSTDPSAFWSYNYNQIRACNAVLSTLIPSINEGTASDETLLYAAQALAFRANAYLILAQSFQFTYSGNETKLCVPIITEENENIAATEGCARATVQEVYAQIISDLNTAIEYLANNRMTPASVLDSKPNRFISLAAAYGLRARANLVMEKWAEAANDAQAAISSFSGRPLSLDQASAPGFNDANAANWMWGIAVSETDRVVTTGICNFPSHMGSFTYGYASAVGAWKWINNDLYDGISNSDVRKGWWLDQNGRSANLTAAQQAYVTENGADAYVQVKFAPYQGQLGTSVNASDIPLMRVEEMYLILAEAQGMQNASQGLATLQNFVKTYRDPLYKFTATTSDEVQEEVWRQRRIELWGEGFSYYDMLRLKKELNRVGSGCPAVVTYRIAPSDPVLIFPIPYSEVNTNKLINEDENVNGGGQPSPVA